MWTLHQSIFRDNLFLTTLKPAGQSLAVHREESVQLGACRTGPNQQKKTLTRSQSSRAISSFTSRGAVGGRARFSPMWWAARCDAMRCADEATSLEKERVVSCHWPVISLAWQGRFIPSIPGIFPSERLDGRHCPMVSRLRFPHRRFSRFSFPCVGLAAVSSFLHVSFCVSYFFDFFSQPNKNRKRSEE